MIQWNRGIYRSLIIITFVGVLIILLFGISQALSYLNTGADRMSMLHLTLKKEQVYFPKVTWKDTINPGRPMEKQTLLEIEQDYLSAWYIRNVAYQMNIVEGIDDYFTKSSRKNIYNTVAFNTQNKVSIHGTTTQHNLALDFYSADGQFAVLSDTDVKEYQRVYKEDKMMVENYELSDYQIMIMLEDGFWRIRHLVKLDKDSSVDSIQQTSNWARVVDNKIYMGDEELQIKGINYYPQQTPWNMFGEDFDIDTIANDFDILVDAGLNTIRIFVPYEAFGKVEINAVMLDQLRQVLDMAEAKELKAIVTLFDFYGDYSVLDWTMTHRHAEQIVAAFTDHKAILAWDVKNEPNLDFATRKKENVTAWLKEMIHHIKEVDPNHLVTIGWSDMPSAELLQNEVDFVSFHYYLDINQFDADFKTLRSNIQKPLVLQEFGLSSSKGLWSPFGPNRKDQAAYHKQFQQMIKEQQIHYLSWTLYDFEQVPSAVVGKLPWRKHKQKHFGFIDRNGNKKEAFEFISW